MIFLPLSVHMVPCPANQRIATLLAQASDEGSTAHTSCRPSSDSIGNLGAIDSGGLERIMMMIGDLLPRFWWLHWRRTGC